MGVWLRRTPPAPGPGARNRPARLPRPRLRFHNAIESSALPVCADRTIGAFAPDRGCGSERRSAISRQRSAIGDQPSAISNQPPCPTSYRLLPATHCLLPTNLLCDVELQTVNRCCARSPRAPGFGVSGRATRLSTGSWASMRCDQFYRCDRPRSVFDHAHPPMPFPAVELTDLFHADLGRPSSRFPIPAVFLPPPSSSHSDVLKRGTN